MTLILWSGLCEECGLCSSFVYMLQRNLIYDHYVPAMHMWPAFQSKGAAMFFYLVVKTCSTKVSANVNFEGCSYPRRVRVCVTGGQ